MIPASELLERRRTRMLRWAGALIFALALHAGGAALSFMQWEEEEADDSTTGAIVLELAPEPVAPPLDTIDAPPAPVLQEASEAQAAAKETQEEVKEEELPPVDPAPMTPEPEVAMPLAKPVEQEKTEEPKPLEERPQPHEATESPALVAMAPPRVEAEPTPAPPLLSRGAATPARSRATWEKSLVVHLNRFKRYPEKARASRDEGTVRIQFALDRAGRVVSSQVLSSSGSSALDQEALGVLERASPFPTPPDDISDPALVFVLPINFHLK